MVAIKCNYTVYNRNAKSEKYYSWVDSKERLYDELMKEFTFINLVGDIASGKTLFAEKYIDYVLQHTDSYVVIYRGEKEGSYSQIEEANIFDSLELMIAYVMYLKNAIKTGQKDDKPIYLVIDEGSSFNGDELDFVLSLLKYLYKDKNVNCVYISFRGLMDFFKGLTWFEYTVKAEYEKVSDDWISFLGV